MSNIQIISDRLILRAIQQDDASDVFQYRSNKVVNKYQGWVPRAISEVQDFISFKVANEINQPGTWVQLVVIQKDNLQLIGDIGIHFLPSDSFQIELGITLDVLHQGKGFATEALRATINYLFGEMKKHRILASVDPRNKPCIDLFERLGFRREAHFRKSLFFGGEWVDDLVYAILKEEWSSD